MNGLHQIAAICLFIGIVGCESMALMPRPDLDRRRADRKDVPGEEIIGTVERVDQTSNQIQLRTTEAKVIAITYDKSTLVYSRKSEVGIQALRPGDLVLVQVYMTPQGQTYADTVRMNDRQETGSKP